MSRCYDLIKSGWNAERGAIVLVFTPDELVEAVGSRLHQLYKAGENGISEEQAKKYLEENADRFVEALMSSWQQDMVDVFSCLPQNPTESHAEGCQQREVSAAECNCFKSLQSADDLMEG